MRTSPLGRTLIGCYLSAARLEAGECQHHKLTSWHLVPGQAGGCCWPLQAEEPRAIYNPSGKSRVNIVSPSLHPL